MTILCKPETSLISEVNAIYALCTQSQGSTTWSDLTGEIRASMISWCKACNGDQSRWHSIVTSVMWADRVTVHWCMGCSLYFTMTSTHPLLPLNIAKATYLLPLPDDPLSSTDLIPWHAVTLQKCWSHLAALTSNVYTTWIKATICFEQEHAATIIKYDFKLSDLMLIRNTAIEKSLNHKMRARYLGPLTIISQNKGGAYIVSKLNGSVLDRPIAAFWVIPYFSHEQIDIPPLNELIDISAHNCTNLRTPPLLTPTKKILPRTHQLATKTEDSLVFSWEGRHIPLVSFLFWTLILNT